MNDQEIVQLIQQKDFRGLEALIDLYSCSICSMIRLILNHPAEKTYLKEVENEVFYKIWDKIEQFDETKSSLGTWSVKIARNLALDKKRQIIRNLKIIPTEFLPETPECDEYLEREQFLELVAILSAEDQLIFLKYFFYQDKPEDIAKDLDLDPAIIYNRLARGKKKLKDALKYGKDRDSHENVF